MAWNAIHTFSVGEVVTAANVNNNFADLSYVARELDYAQITSNPAGITATTEATAVVFITGNSITYDGTRVKVEVFVPGLTQSTITSNPKIVLLRDSTVIGQVRGTTMPTTGGFYGPINGGTFDTPPAGAHTYKAALFTDANTITVNCGNGTSGNLVPAYLRVTVAKQ